MCATCATMPYPMSCYELLHDIGGCSAPSIQSAGVSSVDATATAAMMRTTNADPSLLELGLTLACDGLQGHEAVFGRLRMLRLELNPQQSSSSSSPPPPALSSPSSSGRPDGMAPLGGGSEDEPMPPCIQTHVEDCPPDRSKIYDLFGYALRHEVRFRSPKQFPVPVSTSLHAACSDLRPLAALRNLNQTEIQHQINVPNMIGQTPLHVLLVSAACRQNIDKYEFLDDLNGLLEAVVLLLKLGSDLSVADIDGDTPLLCLRLFMHFRSFEIPVHIARILLEAGSNPNAVNNKKRNLLSFCMDHLDQAIDMTRLILNTGGTVWGPDDKLPPDPGSVMSYEHSAFNYFLCAIIRRRRLENCSATLSVISRMMSEHPTLMQRHVVSSMIRHSRNYSVLGPVYQTLKIGLQHHWKVPQDLKHLCWLAVRRNLGHRGILRGTGRLGVPRSIQRFLRMESDE